MENAHAAGEKIAGGMLCFCGAASLSRGEAALKNPHRGRRRKGARGESKTTERGKFLENFFCGGIMGSQ